MRQVCTLYVLRHAKSSWKDPALEDYARPLNRRGRDAAVTMGHYLRDELPMPDVILCSGARRTVETLERVTQDWSKWPPIFVNPVFYACTLDTWIERLSLLDGAITHALIIGHNPEMELLLRKLMHVDLPPEMPTAALAVLTWTGGWQDIGKEPATLERHIKPRELMHPERGTA